MHMKNKTLQISMLILIVLLFSGCVELIEEFSREMEEQNFEFEVEFSNGELVLKTDEKKEEFLEYDKLYWDTKNAERLLQDYRNSFNPELNETEKIVFCINNGVVDAYLDYSAEFTKLDDLYTQGEYLKNQKDAPETNILLLKKVEDYCIEISEDFSCPGEYVKKDNKCIQVCEDGTEYGTCSLEKPIYCDEGNLIPKAHICGCPEKEEPAGNKCISIYLKESYNAEFKYTLRGKEESVKFTVYKGLNNYLADLPRTYICNPKCPTRTELELRYLDDEKEQKNELNKFVDRIKEKTNVQDDQARIAISIVQSIPYDWEAFETDTLEGRYPYEVLYDQLGVCGEKSKLLVYVLRELGYGLVLLEYTNENHMAIGINCPEQYSQYESKYCFIESTTPSIMTDIEGSYVSAGKLSANPVIIKISTGYSFDSVREEYNDAIKYREIEELGTILPRDMWQKWQDLVQKYGFVFD